MIYHSFEAIYGKISHETLFGTRIMSSRRSAVHSLCIMYLILRPKFKVTYFRFLNYFPFTFRSWSSTKVFEIKGLETWLFSLEIAVLTFHYIRGLSLHNVKGMKKAEHYCKAYLAAIELSCRDPAKRISSRLLVYTVKNIPRLCLSVFDFQTLEKSQESQWSHSVLFNLDINFELQA